MPIFDEIGNFITKGSQDAIRKTKEVTELAKVNSQITETQRAIDLLLAQLGKAVYESGEQSLADRFCAVWSELTNKYATIQSLNQEKMKIKNVSICEECGSEIATDTLFCQKCGNKVKVIESVDVSVGAGSSGMLFCAHCGKPIQQDTVFCPNCGEKNDLDI